MYEILSIVALLLSSYLIVRLLGAADKTEVFFIFFCVASAQIVVSGYLLSSFNRLDYVRGWALLGITTFLVTGGLVAVKRNARLPVVRDINFGAPISCARSIKEWYTRETSRFEKLLLTPMILTVAAVGTLNLVLVVFTAPSNFDSMAYHLARMAYYLQHHNLDFYPANYYAQVAHPKNSTVLMLYTYLMSGRNENLTQLVQFVSYWVAVCSVYGIAHKTGHKKTQSIFAALVSALLVEWLLESNTTQNDMVIAAFIGAAVNFLLAFRETRQRKYLALAALGIGLSLGTSAKAFLVVPSITLISSYVLYTTDASQRRLRNLAFFGASVMLALALFALPAGYVENYRNFGNPLGPKGIMQESYAGKSIAYVARNGTRNLLRFGFEFLYLDGLPPVGVIDRAQSLVRAAPMALVHLLGIDLETSEASYVSFRYQKPPISFDNEDWCSWGILGFALVWIAVILSATGVIKSRDLKFLSWAAIVYVLALSYGGMYEPHRGRYLITCAVFAAPVVGIALTGKKHVRYYVLLVTLLGCLSAVSAVVLRPARPLFAMKSLRENCPEMSRFEYLLISVFEMDRVGQLITNNPRLYRPIRTFDKLVPKDATVAVFFSQNQTFDYPLFGKGLTRTLIPINPFVGGVRAIPVDADYLLYAKGFPRTSSRDVSLGEGWCLRLLPAGEKKAIARLRAEVRSHPYNASYHNRLGIVYGQKGLYDKAIREFNTAVRLAPDEPSYRSNLDVATMLKNSVAEPVRRQDP